MYTWTVWAIECWRLRCSSFTRFVIQPVLGDVTLTMFIIYKVRHVCVANKKNLMFWCSGRVRQKVCDCLKQWDRNNIGKGEEGCDPGGEDIQSHEQTVSKLCPNTVYKHSITQDISCVRTQSQSCGNPAINTVKIAVTNTVYNTQHLQQTHTVLDTVLWSTKMLRKNCEDRYAKYCVQFTACTIMCLTPFKTAIMLWKSLCQILCTIHSIYSRFYTVCHRLNSVVQTVKITMHILCQTRANTVQTLWPDCAKLVSNTVQIAYSLRLPITPLNRRMKLSN